MYYLNFFFCSHARKSVTVTAYATRQDDPDLPVAFRGLEKGPEAPPAMASRASIEASCSASYKVGNVLSTKVSAQKLIIRKF